MKQALSSPIEKQIKKNIYGKPQSANLIFPSGLGDIALEEVQQILNHLWFPQKWISTLSLSSTAIRIDNVHLFALTELLMRAQCLYDIRLIIFEGKTFGNFAFKNACNEINWKYYLTKNMSLKLKVNSISSKAFHESGLKEILSEIVKEHVHAIVDDETATSTLYATLHKNKLTLSISLAGKPLYKRGYREALSASAPLREDIATCCIQKSLTFSRKINAAFLPNTLIIPFSGTGTFAFEYLLSFFAFPPVLLKREYALQQLAFFKPEHFNFLLKKANENILLHSENTPRILCIDNSDNANNTFQNNLLLIKELSNQNGISFIDNLFIPNQTIMHADFLKTNKVSFITSENPTLGNVFIPLNPPYGIRLGRHNDTVAMYKNIAYKVNEISQLTKQENRNLLGFILCPNEETWKSFCNDLHYSRMETYHFIQGGLDIRVCQFYV